MEGTKDVSLTCIRCKHTHNFTVTDSQYYDLKEGKRHIQDILPKMKPCDRELFISGICGTCFEEIFKENEEEDEEEDEEEEVG